MGLVGRTLTVDTGRAAKQANEAVPMHYGDTAVLSTVTVLDKPGEGIDFFPPSVGCEEKLYAVGRVSGSSDKGEGKASKNAILTPRVIDRPMRPLFPRDYRNDATLNNLVMFVDWDCSSELTVMLGSATTTAISDISFNGPCATTQVDLVNGEFVISPTQKQKRASDLALTVASTGEKAIMIGAGANEVSERAMVGAIFRADEVGKQVIAFTGTIVAKCGRPKHNYASCAVPEELFAAIKEIVPPKDMEVAVFTDDGQTRRENIRQIIARLEGTFADNEEWLNVPGEAIYQYQKETVCKMILKDHRHPGGRGITEIRPLAVEIDLFPRVHGFGMFTHGQTQILDACTPAPLPERQKLDGISGTEIPKRYIHHCNFPSHSAGEAEPPRSPGCCEIRHGALTKRALIPVLPSEEESPYAIRAVSETMESNGSTSQVSVCSSSLSLIATGVPIGNTVAGTFCGLVTGDSGGNYTVLIDIQSLEGFFGNMNLKVGDTHKGITVIQMDIKIHGLTRPIVGEAIAKTRGARIYILDEVMAPRIAGSRKEVGRYAPKIGRISIDPQKIDSAVGRQGEVINKIIEGTGVKIDIPDDGSVSVCGTDKEVIEKAIHVIRNVVTDIETDQVITGRIVCLMSFGAFVELSPNKDDTVHISKLPDKCVEKVEDVTNIGDEVIVKVMEVDKVGRINPSMRPRDLAPKAEVKAEEKTEKQDLRFSCV